MLDRQWLQLSWLAEWEEVSSMVAKELVLIVLSVPFGSLCWQNYMRNFSVTT